MQLEWHIFIVGNYYYENVNIKIPQKSPYSSFSFPSEPIVRRFSNPPSKLWILWKFNDDKVWRDRQTNSSNDLIFHRLHTDEMHHGGHDFPWEFFPNKITSYGRSSRVNLAQHPVRTHVPCKYICKYVHTNLYVHAYACVRMHGYLRARAEYMCTTCRTYARNSHIRSGSRMYGFVVKRLCAVTCPCLHTRWCNFYTRVCTYL